MNMYSSTIDNVIISQRQHIRKIMEVDNIA